jgi:ribonuclease BN (tRNA processing enzyme)
MKRIIYCSILFFLFTQNTNAQLSATIVGSGSPNFSLETNGKTKILVDMGNGTQANLSKLEVSDKTLDALLITHHHLDHNEELAPIFIHNILGRQSFRVFGPPNTTNFISNYIQLYKEDINYRLGKTQHTFTDREKDFTVNDIVGGETFYIDSIKISTVKVNHTIHTVAYRFDFNGQSIVVTGDLTYTKELKNLASNADYLIIDAGGMIYENMTGNQQEKRNPRNAQAAEKKEAAHVNLEESSKMAQESNVKTLVYTHFMPGKINESASVSEIKKKYSGSIIFGKDLMKIDLSQIYKAN